MIDLTKKTFEPTQEQIDAGMTVFIAMAWTETIRPVVEGYQKAILEKHQFTNKGEIKMMEKSLYEIDVKEYVILKPEHSYLLGKDDFAVYDAECKKARDEAKLYVEIDDFCPLLVAQHQLSEAKKLLTEAMEPITGIKFDDICWHMENYKKLIELTLTLFAKYFKEKGIKVWKD